MSERSIFLKALDQEDPAARAAYLDTACAGRPELRHRIERLLQSHEAMDSFLEVPAMEQWVQSDQSLSFLSPPCQAGVLGWLDHYEVLEVIGRGATGVVLKARDSKLQRIVALKVLAPRLAASAAARQRFVREAQAAAAVRDDHVIAIYAVSDEGPLPYLVMEYIAGITLEDRLRQGRVLGLLEILRIGLQTAKGLAAAHAQGLIHRDIKPSNILLENGVQRVKITDFGLALVASDAERTESQVLAGTPLFMSPEQARGQPTDYRSDLFSLGSVLYSLCTGRPPFEGDNAAAALKSVREDRPPPVREINRDVPAWLGDLLGQLHAKEALARPSSAQVVADLLGRQLAQLQQPLLPLSAVESQSLRPTIAGTSPEAAPHLGLKRLLLVSLVAVLLTLAVIAAAWKILSARLPGEESGPQTQSSNISPIALELRRETIPPTLLALAGGGVADRAPPELVAVLGDGRFLLPRIGQTAWPEPSPDGQLLAVPLDEDVVLFEAQTGAYVRSLPGPGGRVFNVTFSRDSRLLAATTRNESGGEAVRVWDLAADRMLFTNPQPGPTVSCAAVFSADAKHLFTEGNGRLHVWEVRSGQQVQELEIHPKGIGPLCFSPDGRRLAVAVFFDRKVKIFEWDGKRLTENRTLEGHRALVSAVAFSPDGKVLASGSVQELKLWNADTLEEMHSVATAAEQLAFAPDGRTLYAASTIEQHKTIHTFTRWDVDTYQELPPLAVEVAVEPVRVFHVLSRDGKVLFVVQQHAATNVKAIDTTSGKERYPHQGHTAPLQAVAISPDGRTLASAGDDWGVKLWDLTSGRVLRTHSGHTGAVQGLAFSPDGQLLASGSRDGTIALWDVRSGTEVRALHGHARLPSRLQFSPDGKILAAGGEDGRVKRWDVATGKEISSLPGHTGLVRCVAFNPDGKWLASGGEDRTVLLHHLAEGRSQSFQTPYKVHTVAFSPNGRTLAAAGEGPQAAVRLWDLPTGMETTWPGPTASVGGLAFSPSAALLASCSEDDTVRLWDLTGSEPRVRTIGPGPFGGGVRAIAFTPDGRYLATANVNGTVYLLKVADSH